VTFHHGSEPDTVIFTVLRRK